MACMILFSTPPFWVDCLKTNFTPRIHSSSSSSKKNNTSMFFFSLDSAYAWELKMCYPSFERFISMPCLVNYYWPRASKAHIKLVLKINNWKRNCVDYSTVQNGKKPFQISCTLLALLIINTIYNQSNNGLNREVRRKVFTIAVDITRRF